MRSPRVFRLLLALASTTTMAAVGLTVAGTTSAGAIAPVATCKFNGVSNNGLVPNVTPGGTVLIACSGLPANTTLAVVEASAIADLDSADAADEADLGGAKFPETTSTGTLSYSYVLPNPWADSADSNAACPLPQSQTNAGLTGCAIAVASISPQVDYGDALLQYTGQLTPQTPTVTLSPTTVAAGDVVSLANGTGGNFWGNAFNNQSISASAIKVGGVDAASSTAVVNAATATYTKKKGSVAAHSTLTPPTISGGFVVPCGISGTKSVTINEPNLSLLTGTITATSSITISANGSQPAVTGVSPSHGPKTGGNTVTISGCNFTGVTGAGGVKFGTSDAASYNVVNSTTITAVPAAGTGTVHITVDNSGNVSSATSAASNYTFGVEGYDMVGSDGGVFSFGDAVNHGSLPGIGVKPAKPIVGIAATSDYAGYWLAGADGGTFAFGDAVNHGSLPGLGITPAKPVVGIASPDSGGYWLAGADGGVYAFGDAHFYGSLPSKGVKPNAPIVGIASTSTGLGYWLVGADGGVYAFGDAVDYGSLPGIGVTPKAPVAGIASGAAGGYWLVGADGGVFAFGNASEMGSLPGIGVTPAEPVVGIVAPDQSGYWLVGADGGVYSFGDASFFGSLPALGVKVAAPISNADLA